MAKILIFEVTYFLNSPFSFSYKKMGNSIEGVLRKNIGVGWESTAKIFIEEEIDSVAFY